MPIRNAVALVVFVMVGCTAAPVTPSSKVQPVAIQAHAEWLESVLKEISAIKPGITRSELEKTFEQDGGLMTIGQPRYCYRGCTCIKIDVTFKDSDIVGINIKPDAKVVSISKPYFQFEATD